MKRQTDKWRNRHTGRRMNVETDKQTEEINIRMKRQIDNGTYKWMNGQTDREVEER